MRSRSQPTKANDIMKENSCLWLGVAWRFNVLSFARQVLRFHYKKKKKKNEISSDNDLSFSSFDCIFGEVVMKS